MGKLAATKLILLGKVQRLEVELENFSLYSKQWG